MEFFRPQNWDEAVEFKAAHPEAEPIFGGTDVMVELNGSVLARNLRRCTGYEKILDTIRLAGSFRTNGYPEAA